MAAIIVPASLQDIEEAFEIGVDIGMGVIDRMAHAGLGRKMHHRRETVLGKQTSNRRTVGEIELHETKARMLAQDVEPRLLQGRIVIAVEVVQADDIPAFGQELAGDVEADETRRSRDQNCLIRHRIPKTLRTPFEGHSAGAAAPAEASLPAASGVSQYPVVRQE